MYIRLSNGNFQQNARKNTGKLTFRGLGAKVVRPVKTLSKFNINFLSTNILNALLLLETVMSPNCGQTKRRPTWREKGPDNEPLKWSVFKDVAMKLLGPTRMYSVEIQVHCLRYIGEQPSDT